MQGNLTRRHVILLALTATASALAAPPQGERERAGCADQRFQPALQTIRAVMAEHRLPSIAIAVGERGRAICEAAFGFADVERQIASTPRTRYSLASISKPFTATAIMHMVEARRIDLKRPANDYLAAAKLRAFEGRAEEATVLRLLTHTAGLPLHYQFFYQGGPQVSTMDDAIGRYGVIVYPPGERYFYANFGYGVLERILERTTGRSYADVLRDSVLEPLGLADVMVSDGANIDGHRAALRYGSDGNPIAPYTFDHVGASGVWSSARDLLRFGMFHLGHDANGADPPLTSQTRRLMQQRHADADGAGRVRGLGWSINENLDGWRQVAHTGSMPGVATILSLYPEADAAIVVLANVSNAGAVARVERALRSVLLPARPTNANTETSPARPAGDGPGAMPALPAALTGRWIGTIQLPDGPIETELDVPAAGEVKLRVGDRSAVGVDGPRMVGHWLTGRISLQLRGPDAAPEAARMNNSGIIMLTSRDGLSGWISVLSRAVPTYGAVSYPMRLTKAKD